MTRVRKSGLKSPRRKNKRMFQYEKTYIYGLVDPSTDSIRYVGVTDTPKERMQAHLNDKGTTHKCRWVSKLLRNGLTPIMEVLDEVKRDDWQFWEQWCIELFRSWGVKLTNGDNGGLGKNRYSPELRRKISNTLKGRIFPEKRKRILQYSLSGNFLREWESVFEIEKVLGIRISLISNAVYHKDKTSDFLWTRKESEDIPLKIHSKYDCFGNRIISIKTRKKLSDFLKGKNTGREVSLETREKMRKAKLGVAPTNKGKKASPEIVAVQRENCKSKKKVIQKDLQGNVIKIWGSAKEASDLTGVARASIRKCVLKKFKHAGNFIWEYETYGVNDFSDIVCKLCGKPTSLKSESELCRKCYLDSSRKHYSCEICGKKLQVASTKVCRACWKDSVHKLKFCKVCSMSIGRKFEIHMACSNVVKCNPYGELFSIE